MIFQFWNNIRFHDGACPTLRSFSSWFLETDSGPPLVRFSVPRTTVGSPSRLVSARLKALSRSTPQPAFSTFSLSLDTCPNESVTTEGSRRGLCCPRKYMSRARNCCPLYLSASRISGMAWYRRAQSATCSITNANQKTSRAWGGTAWSRNRHLVDLIQASHIAQHSQKINNPTQNKKKNHGKELSKNSANESLGT